MLTTTNADNQPVESTTELPADKIAIADTGAGSLVFTVEREGDREHIGRSVEVGRELIAFVDVSDWSVISSALRARGLGVGATTQLPEYDSIDQLTGGDRDRVEPTRSEPADFGGGESTGVQEL